MDHQAKTTLAPPAAADREDWFLSRLDDEPLPAEGLLDFLRMLQDGGEPDRADAWAELLEDTLIERGALVQAVRVLRARERWPATARDGAFWKARAMALLESDHDQRSLVAHAGFNAGLTPAECFRRLDLLLALRPGALCLDKTWGFGLVRRVDYFYGRVEIDFEHKQDHFLSLAYAAESLELLSDDHLLARQHREPEELARWVRERPAEIVRVALHSYGPLTAAQLQEKLTAHLVPVSDWKKFWDTARAGLKKDPLVEVPAKRSEPLRLLDRPTAFDADWLKALAAERDMDRIVAEVERYERERETMESPVGEEAARQVVGERLAFVIKGVGRSRPDLEVAAALAADRLGLAPERIGTGGRIREWMGESRYLQIIRNLPAKTVEFFLAALERADAEAARGLWLANLNRMGFTALAEAIARLRAAGWEERCAGVLRDLLAARKTEVEVLYWITRNMDRLAAWHLASPSELMTQVLDELARDYSGERLKVKNQLRSRFEQKEWLQPMLAALDERKRREVLQRVRESPAWSALDRQSLMGQIVKMYPELEQVLSDGAVESAAETAPAAVTSWRTYRARQAQMDKLVREDIPRNSRELAQARAHGDLRENAEFKAAKEMQGILFRRRSEWEVMLHRVSPTDFRDLPCDRVGLGTGVRLRYPDGREERYHILGEWDQDEALHIISSQTRMAQALQGRRAGETVRVPTESGDVECTLAEVGGLPDEVRAWIGGP
ncbi:MAG: GreA/GreB family elongation factor [Verrucomicrobia bacterium]|nr:GreA/GreB family elongation factor [Verrucomicrobiota bacterium]